jgi:acetyl esterase/lipase
MTIHPDASGHPRPTHPDLRRMARWVPRRMVWRATLPLLRAVFDMRSAHTPTGVEVITLPTGAMVRVYRPAPAGPRRYPALLWIHGGGYIVGRAAQDDRQCLRFALQLGVIVASVDYRLAPEHCYPAALEDCYDALTWLAGLQTVNPLRLAIGGASAGGGLAAALAFMARDRGEVNPAAQLLLYPMLDDRTSVGQATDRRAGLRLWNHASNRWGWAAYLGNADPQVAVPARREDLAGLPPAWIGVGTLDLFTAEDLDYAQRLSEAGVSCSVEIVPGAFHGFDVVAPNTAIAQQFFDSQCAMLRDVFS